MLTLKVRKGVNEYQDINLSPSAKIYIMGVCGVAMSALAGMLKQKGYKVFGSDRACYSPVKEQLANLNVEIYLGYSMSYIQDADLIIVGNVVGKAWPVAKGLLESGKPYLHLPEALAFVMGKRNPCIMVTGTHGKTTVSCLLAWVLQQCGKNPGFMIGGVAENFQSNFLLNSSDYFVLEGDEYDTAFFEKTPKFLHYPATYIILTSAELDHVDIYNSPKEVKDAFRLLVTQKKSKFIMGYDSAWMPELMQLARDRTLTYGIQKADYQIQSRHMLFETNKKFKGQLISVKQANAKSIEFEIPLPGEHNACNFLSVWVLANMLKLDLARVRQAFKTFKGVRRRLQVLGEFAEVLLIEDFAHHPTAVRAAIQSVREMYPNRRLLALFEPRSNTSRRNIFQQEYQDSLALADIVFCMEASDNIPKEERFSAELLVQNLKKQGKPAFAAHKVPEMVQTLTKLVKKGDCLLIMSNGDFGGIYSLLPSALT